MPDFRAFLKLVMSLCKLLGCNWIAEYFGSWVSAVTFRDAHFKLLLSLPDWWGQQVPNSAQSKQVGEPLVAHRSAFTVMVFLLQSSLSSNGNTLSDISAPFFFKCTS